MKIAFLLPPGMLIIGSKYKYKAMFKQFAEVGIIRNHSPEQVAKELTNYDPDYVAVMGDAYTEWQYAALYGYRYILLAMDIASLRVSLNADKLKRERNMVLLADKIICTSEDHANYLNTRYGVNPQVVHLRPLRADLGFKPLPKLPGKHLVYAGGITSWKKRTENYGYRAYHKIFLSFKKQGWKVHVYPGYELKSKTRKEYQKYGFIIHKRVPEGRKLYQELSQYTAGLQSYNKWSCPVKTYKYAMACRPNKLWLYLAAGIPTISFCGGNGSPMMVNGGWGVRIGNLNNLDNVKLPVITESMRQENVIDNDLKRLKEYILGHSDTDTAQCDRVQQAVGA